jgi:hypothetical protein
MVINTEPCRQTSFIQPLSNNKPKHTSMKIFLTTASLLISFFISVVHGQTVDSISNIFTTYESDLTTNSTQKPNGKKSQKELDKLAYNPKMLNMFIANNISNYLSSSKDISLQKYYAVLESGDGSLFVGYNFMFRPNKLSRLKHIANIGLKTDVEDNFSAIRSDGKFNPEMAANLKYTHIFRGKIKFDQKHRDAISNYRSKYLQKKYKADLAKYADAEVAADKDENTDLEAKLKYGKDVLTEDEKKELIEDEYITQYEKIATDEEKFITDNKVFNSIVSNWITTELYIPAGKKEYKLSPATTVFATTDEQFYNFKAAILWTRMQKWSSKQTIYTTLQLSTYNLNNIITKDLKAYKFETIASQGGNNQTTADTKDAYVGVFDKDFAKSIKAEMVAFLYKDIIGLSVAAELVTGQFSARNWKLAIPVSLKDKEDKPSINLELQFKEVYKTHSFGISVGYAFGRFFN